RSEGDSGFGVVRWKSWSANVRRGLTYSDLCRIPETVALALSKRAALGSHHHRILHPDHFGGHRGLCLPQGRRETSWDVAQFPRYRKSTAANVSCRENSIFKRV